MSIYKSSSLAMIPTAYKDGKLYSVRPNDGDGDFTFSRGSNLAATRVDVNGLIEKGRENVMPYSQDFTNAQWVAFNATKTTNQSDPNGGSTAVRVVSTAVVNSGLYVFDTTNFGTNKIRTASVWMKGAVGGEVVQMGDATNRVSVTLTTEWVRYEAYAIDASTYFVLYSNSTAQTWDVAFAQYEDGLVATDYIETTSSTAQAGILEDMPRLDYSGGASCPALLLEPQRSNILIQSEYYNTTPYSRVNASVTHNDTTSPEGVLNAAKLISNGGASRIETFPTLSDNTIYTTSIFAKRGDVNFIMISVLKKDNSQDKVFFNLLEGTKGTTSGSPISSSIEAVGDYYRVTLTINSSSGATTPRLQYLIANTDNNVVTSSGEYIYVYGAQLEAGSYPTSYIPTYGASVTRSKEGAQVTSVSDLIGQTQGTLFAEVDSFGVGEVANRIFGVSNGASAERVIMLTRSNGFRFIVTNSSVNGVDYTKYTTTEGVHKLAMTYDANEVRIFVDGVKVHTDPAFTLPSSLNSVHIGKVEINNSYNNNFGGSVKQSALFPTALTDSECIALTTL